MTPVPFDLPLRPPEAAELAGLIFESAERRPLTDDVRNRVAARARAFEWQTIAPCYGSLARDLVHHSTYYMAVDGIDGAPLLLHMAPATAPTSAICPKPLLIGRIRRPAGPELVINAIPFGPTDTGALENFVTRVDSALLPRPYGTRPTIVAHTDAPAAFDAFRAILKRTGRNLAAIGASGNECQAYYAALWSAIRAGWRDGFGFVVRIVGPLAEARETIARAARATTLVCDPAAILGAGDLSAAIEFAERVYEQIRQTRSALKIARPFDFELALDRSGPTAPADLAFCLEALKAGGHAVQLVALDLTHATDGEVRELAAVCHKFQCGLDFSATSAEQIAMVARATAGRVACSLWDACDAAAIAAAAEALIG